MRGFTLLAGLALPACATTASTVPAPQYLLVGIDTGKQSQLPGRPASIRGRAR